MTYMDNVEIYNCSQRDTFKAALRWQAATQGHSSITNSAVHGGIGWGVQIISSANVIMNSNAIIGFRPIGVNIQSVSGAITFTNNIVGDI